jgi:alpha-1,6-mannosyltransferase
MKAELPMAPKTLHLTNAWHATSGGIATFYRALIEAANARQQPICLVVPGETDSFEQVAEFAKIYRVAAPRSRLNPDYRTIYPSQFLAEGSPIQKILAAECPDVVEVCDKYTFNYFGGLLRRRLLRGMNFRPVVVGLTCERMDDNFRTYVGWFPGAAVLCRAYMKWLYFPFFDHHIAVSEYTAEELQRAAGAQIVPRGTWIRPMGVDLRSFSPLRRTEQARRVIEARIQATSGASILVYAGRLAPEKNLALLFDAFEQLTARSNYRLVVAGDGIERSRWEQLCAARVTGRVSFLGYIKTKEELADLLANADAFIHPNPREPFGIAPLEAMASGLPLIVPNAGGVRSYANPENAWIAAPDPKSFAEAIEKALNNPTESLRRAHNALQTAAELSWPRVAGSFLDLYAALHRATLAGENVHVALPAPAFTSKPASGLRLALSRGASRGVEVAFRLFSWLDTPVRRAAYKSGA